MSNLKPLIINSCVLLCTFWINLGHSIPALASPNGPLAYFDSPQTSNRLLFIKPYAPIENVRSPLYEVYQEPYTFDLRAISAVALIQGEGESAVRGELVLIQRHPPTGPVLIRGNITGLPAGKHGLHIHQAGDLRQGCEKLGDHYNPYRLHHGGPGAPERHVGDLGNVEAGEDGTAKVQIVDPVMSLNGPRGVIGRAIVISMNEDDFGRSGTAESVTNGSSGPPIACGVIAYIR